MRTVYLTPSHGNETICFRLTPAKGSHQPAMWHGDHGVSSIVAWRNADPIADLRDFYPGCTITDKSTGVTVGS